MMIDNTLLLYPEKKIGECLLILSLNAKRTKSRHNATAFSIILAEKQPAKKKNGIDQMK